MGFFFKSAFLKPVVSESLSKALATPPDSVNQPEQMVSEMADQVQQQVTGKFSWVRLVIALLFLVVLFAAGIYTARDPSSDVKEWSKTLLHSFELLLGAVVGLITGEAAAKR